MVAINVGIMVANFVIIMLIIRTNNPVDKDTLNKLLNEVFLLRKIFKYFSILLVKISVRKVLNTEMITFS